MRNTLRRIARVLATVFCCYCWGSAIATTYSATATATDDDDDDGYVFEPTNTNLDSPKASTVLLVALQDGPAGDQALIAWSAYVGGASANWRESSLPPVWVLCTNDAIEEAVRGTPHVLPFVADESASWAEVMGRFMIQTASVVGLFGEGSLPHPDLAESVKSLESTGALALPVQPTAIIVRSRRIIDGKEWLPDKFIGQIWCNRGMFAASRLTTSIAGLDKQSVQNLTLLEVFPRILRADQSDTAEAGVVVLVDGTNVLGSIFDLDIVGAEEPTRPTTTGKATGAHAQGGNLYIGTLPFALVFDGHRDARKNGVRTSVIAEAHWPPAYVLANVATDDRLIIVGDVSCACLDMGTNFLRSVRRASDAKVLFVAMDDVSFDFMDAMAPGCTALIPKGGARVSTDGEVEFLVRPSILHHIINHGYNVLWSDVNSVWLGDPLPLLPDFGDPSAGEVVLQQDGIDDTRGACFIFVRATKMGRALLKLWKNTLKVDRISESQGLLTGILTEMVGDGLQVEYVPRDVIFRANAIFGPQDSNYVDLYKSEALIVHNDWLPQTDPTEQPSENSSMVAEGRGKYKHRNDETGVDKDTTHNAKKTRFERYHLWDVGRESFPGCLV